MRLNFDHLDALQRHTDRLYATVPRRRPSAQALKNCRLVAHRGDHDQFTIVNSSPLDDQADSQMCIENTHAAFERALAAGVWGIECDIQWTRDGVPMIIHDPDAGRVFAQPHVQIPQCSQAQLNNACPLIPSLDDVINQYCPDLHLMLEIKADTWRPEFESVLYHCLQALTPGVHYHLLCLDMQLLETLQQFDPACMIAVSLINTRSVFDHVMTTPWAAMSGHYVLLNKRMRKQLQSRGKQVGTGFVASRRTLFRELNLGAEWIFSNHAVQLQGEVDRLLDDISD